MRRLSVWLTIGILMCLATNAFAVAPSSFKPFSIWGISTAFDNSKTYSVSLDSGAYLLYGSTKYNISAITGFYLINQNDQMFKATGSSITLDKNNEWTWGQNPQDNKSNTTPDVVNVAGWLGSNNAKSTAKITQGNFYSFTYASLALGNTSPTLAYHLAVDLNASNNWVNPFTGSADSSLTAATGGATLQPVPEPASIVAALSMLAPAGLIFRRRK